MILICPALCQLTNFTFARIGEINSNPLIGNVVIVNGKIVTDYANGYFLFSDETGQIRLNADAFPNEWLPMNQDITIIGEVNRHDGALEILVLYVSTAPSSLE